MIFFTADTHFDCGTLVANTRPLFDLSIEHDGVVIDNINRKVGRNDTLVIAGDFCRDKPGRYRPLINCRNIFFILGNHDREGKIRSVFGGNVWHQKKIKLTTGETVWVSHYPMAFWNGSHKGWYHAYGHIHYDTTRERMMDKAFPGRRSMDVGLDAAKARLGEYEPFSETEFLYFLTMASGHDIIKRG